MTENILGATLRRELVKWSWEEGHTMLVAGLKGSGKSSFIRAIVCRLVEAHSPDELQLLLIDAASGRELNTFDNLPHLWGAQVIKVEGSSPEFLRPVEVALEALEGERVERQRLLASDAAAKTWVDYCGRHPENARPNLLVVVDEFQELSPDNCSDKELKARRRGISFKLATAAKMGRAVGIWQLDATQRPTVQGIPGELKSQLAGRLVFKMVSELDSRLALEHNSHRAANLPDIVGRAIFQFGRTEVEIQTLHLTPGEALRRVAAVRHKWRKWRSKLKPFVVPNGAENDPESSPNGGPENSRGATIPRTNSKAELYKPISQMNEAEVWTSLQLLKTPEELGVNPATGLQEYRRYVNRRSCRKWQLVCRLVNLRSQGMCERCTTAAATQVHHDSYEHLFHEEDHLGELRDLCRPCHEYVSDESSRNPVAQEA